MRTYTFDHARAQILLNPFKGVGCHGFDLFNFKLHAVLMIVKPDTGGINKLPRRYRGCIARHGDQLPLALAFNPDDKKTTGFTMKSDALYRSLQMDYWLMISMLQVACRSGVHRTLVISVAKKE